MKFAPSERRLVNRLLALLGLVLGAAGCSAMGALDAITPSGAYSAVADIAYGPQPRQRLDLYVPNGRAPTGSVIVFFYGGNWQTGAKGDYRFVAESLTRQGHIVVIPDYRVYPEVVFPGFLEDGARAVAWVTANIARYGGNPDAIYLMGHSAGAYNAAMLALHPAFLRGAGISRERIAGVIGIAGPYDFLPLSDPTLMKIFGPEETRARTQPINYVDRSATPMLLVTGDGDTSVLPRNTRRLAARLRQEGVAVQEIVYPDKGHIEIILGLSSRLRGDSRLLGDIGAFIRS